MNKVAAPLPEIVDLGENDIVPLPPVENQGAAAVDADNIRRSNHDRVATQLCNLSCCNSTQVDELKDVQVPKTYEEAVNGPQADH